MKKSNIFIIGSMGSGKTTIGRMLAKKINYTFVDTDHVIEERTGTTILTIFDIEGEKGFRLREKVVIEEITQQSNIVLATGGGSVLNAENRQALSNRGFVIYLKSSAEVLKKRMRFDTKRPLIQGQDKDAIIQNIIKEREPLYQKVSDYVIDSHFYTSRKTVYKIIDTLKEKNIIER